jgi:hypothetical protein
MGILIYDVTCPDIGTCGKKGNGKRTCNTTVANRPIRAFIPEGNDKFYKTGRSSDSLLLLLPSRQLKTVAVGARGA